VANEYPVAAKDISVANDRRNKAKQVLQYLGEVRNSGGDLNALPVGQGKWERIESVVDSGATVSVMSPEMAAEHEVVPSAASKAGVTYQVANGDEIENLGQKIIPVITDEGYIRGMQPQIANVTTSLESVRQMYNSGHMVVFDGPESFVMHKATGQIDYITDNGVNYTVGRWVIPKAEFQRMEAEASFRRQAP
jgi:hypothetical protein